MNAEQNRIQVNAASWVIVESHALERYKWTYLTILMQKMIAVASRESPEWPETGLRLWVVDLPRVDSQKWRKKRTRRIIAGQEAPVSDAERTIYKLQSLGVQVCTTSPTKRVQTAAIAVATLSTIGVAVRCLLGRGTRSPFARLAKLRVDGVPVGDIIISESLARNYSIDSVGRIKCSIQMLAVMFNVFVSASILTRQTNLLPSLGYFSSPEPTYTYEAIARLATRAEGIGRVFTAADDSIALVEPDKATPLQLDVARCHARHAVPNDEAPSEEELQNARSRILGRFQGEWDLPYMQNLGHNFQNSAHIRHRRQLKPSACVFLHDFGDGEYHNGIDGYETMYEWVYETIATLCSEKSLTVFVKPHPTGTGKTINAARLERLRRAFADEPDIEWLDPAFSTDAVVSNIKFAFGVTRYGTVAEELAYLQVPVIASRNSPYGPHHSIVTSWTGRKQYGELLRQCSREPDRIPRPSREEVLKYVALRYRNTAHRVDIRLMQAAKSAGIRVTGLTLNEVAELTVSQDYLAALLLDRTPVRQFIQQNV